MEHFEELIQSLFIGFGIFIFTTSFIHFKSEKRDQLIIDLTDSATLIIRLTGLAYIVILLFWLADVYATFQPGEFLSIKTRLTGPYWFAYWIYPLCYGIFPQLLWVKKIRKSKAMRLTIAFLLLFTIYLERIIIIITSLHRDYIPSSWTMLPGFVIIYDWIVSLIIFVLVLGLVHFTKSITQRNTKKDTEVHGD